MTAKVKKCTICRSEIAQHQRQQEEQIKIESFQSGSATFGSSSLYSTKNNEFCANRNGISKWKLLSMECLCMLYGLPLNHSMISSLTGETVNNGRNEPLFCHMCLENMGNVHFVFWQLHSLELKLIQLQTLMFQKLSSNWESTEDVSSIGMMKSLLDEIKFGKESWPRGVYISRWKEASEYIEQIITTPSPVQEESGIIKAEPEFDHNEDFTDFIPLENLAHNQDDLDENSLNQKSDNHEDYSYPEDYDEDSFAEKCDSDNEGEKNSLKTKAQKIRTRSPWNTKTKVKNDKFMCTVDPDICSRTWTSRSRLSLHIKDFHEGRIHICDHDGCVEKFKSENKLMLHKKYAHVRPVGNSFVKMPGPKGIFLCTVDPDICSRGLKSIKLLNRHIKEFHEGRTHHCDYEDCVEKFLSEQSLSWHKRRAHGEYIPPKIVKIEEKESIPNSADRKASYLCTVDPDICSRSWTTIKRLNMHIKEFHEGRIHLCDQEGCVQKFLSKKSLLMHKKNDHGVGVMGNERTRKLRLGAMRIKRTKAEKSEAARNASQVCHICGITTLRQKMKDHFQTYHLGFGKFVCELCCMDFTKSEDFKSHENLHAETSTSFPFTCVAPNCGVVHSNSCDLKMHVKSNHMNSGLKCQICGKMKPNHFLLKRHLENHTRVKNKICDLCGKGFFTSYLLNVHNEKVHLGKTYACDICGVTLTSKKSLERHISNHQGVKPFKCSVCSKTFNTSNSLNKHEEIHSGIKKYECHLCGKRFKQSQNLRQHLTKGAHRPKPEQTETQHVAGNVAE